MSFAGLLIGDVPEWAAGMATALGVLGTAAVMLYQRARRAKTEADAADRKSRQEAIDAEAMAHINLETETGKRKVEADFYHTIMCKWDEVQQEIRLVERENREQFRRMTAESEAAKAESSAARFSASRAEAETDKLREELARVRADQNTDAAKCREEFARVRAELTAEADKCQHELNRVLARLSVLEGGQPK